MSFEKAGKSSASSTPATGPTKFPRGEAEPSSGVNGKAVAGAGALAALAAALRVGKPGAITSGLKYANALRQQLMLSGLAPIKSALGNVGAGVEEAVTTGNMRPLKELFSRQTLTDVKDAYNKKLGHNPVGVTLPGPTPGRAMGAMDTAGQRAFVRAGFSPAEAENRMLQSPLQQDLAEALDSPLAQYVHPFRRTPFNQFIEGWKTVGRANKGDKAARRGLAIYGAAGAAHGAATSEDRLPISVPVAVAGSARYGLPYGLAAILGRELAGGNANTSGIAGSMLPVSEYSYNNLTDVARPFKKPAAFTAFERLFGED